MIWPVCLTGTECVITLCIETNKNKKTDDIWMYDINVPFPFPFPFHKLNQYRIHVSSHVNMAWYGNVILL